MVYRLFLRETIKREHVRQSGVHETVGVPVLLPRFLPGVDVLPDAASVSLFYAALGVVGIKIVQPSAHVAGHMGHDHVHPVVHERLEVRVREDVDHPALRFHHGRREDRKGGHDRFAVPVVETVFLEQGVETAVELLLQVLLTGDGGDGEREDIVGQLVHDIIQHLRVGEQDEDPPGEVLLYLLVVVLAVSAGGGHDEFVEVSLQDLALGLPLQGLGGLERAPVVGLLDLLPEVVGDVSVPYRDDVLVVRRHLDDIAVVGELELGRRYHRDQVVGVDVTVYVAVAGIGG